MSLLRRAFRDPSPAVRGSGVLFVQDREFKNALPLVRRLLGDKSSEVRRDSAECLGALENLNIAHPGLRRLLSDPSPVVRAEATESLMLIADRGALARIARLLADRVPYVRSYTASSIGGLKGSAYISKIKSALEKEKKDLARVGMLEAMVILGERNSLPNLLELLKSGDYYVRCAVANTVERMPLSKNEMAMAVRALSNANRRPIVGADKSTINRVIRCLRNRSRYRNY